MTPRKSSYVLPVLALLGLAWPLAGCLSEQERDQNLPLLTGLTFDGQAAGNGRVLLFSVDFRDGDRDLAAGTFVPLINDKPSVAEPLPLDAMLLKSNLPLDTRAGRLEFELEVKIDDQDRPPKGATFKVGVQVTDGAGHPSNIPTVTLEIGY